MTVCKVRLVVFKSVKLISVNKLLDRIYLLLDGKQDMLYYKYTTLESAVKLILTTPRSNQSSKFTCRMRDYDVLMQMHLLSEYQLPKLQN